MRLNGVVLVGEGDTTQDIILDASKTPKRFDLKDKNGRVRLGIYRLDGDTLTLIINTSANNANRPAGFKGNRSVQIEVLERPKP